MIKYHFFQQMTQGRACHVNQKDMNDLSIFQLCTIDFKLHNACELIHNSLLFILLHITLLQGFFFVEMESSVCIFPYLMSLDYALESSPGLSRGVAIPGCEMDRQNTFYGRENEQYSILRQHLIKNSACHFLNSPPFTSTHTAFVDVLNLTTVTGQESREAREGCGSVGQELPGQLQPIRLFPVGHFPGVASCSVYHSYFHHEGW